MSSQECPCILDNGTNATSPDIDSEERSDIQEETASDYNMDIDDVNDIEMF